MIEYITKGEAKEAVDYAIELFSSECDAICDEIDRIPNADVAPVVHGRWKLCYEDDRHQIEGDECTACGFQHYGTTINHYCYCPACGAKMDLEDDEQ